MKKLLFITALLLSMVAAVFAEWIAPTQEAVVNDTLDGLTPDTLTFIKSEKTDVIQITICFDSLGATKTASTDTVQGAYRVFNSQYELTKGRGQTGSKESVTFITATGTSATVLDWMPGGCYTFEIDPLPGPFQQLILTGSYEDTIGYRAECYQVNNQ